MLINSSTPIVNENEKVKTGNEMANFLREPRTSQWEKRNVAKIYI